jgi:hypothetical protein
MEVDFRKGLGSPFAVTRYPYALDLSKQATFRAGLL